MKIVQIGTNKGYDDLSNHLLSNYDSLEFGLFVEPNQLHSESIKKCYEKYPNIIIENIAVKTPSQNQDNLTIYYHTNDYPDYQLASCDIEHIKKHLWCPHLWRDGEGEIKSFDVPSLTIDELFDKYKIYELDWLCLDVEGIDAEILLTTDWEKYKIKRIEFEQLHLGDYKKAIYNMMVGLGYKPTQSLHEYDWAFEKNIIHDDKKLKGLPPVHFISVTDTVERRELLYEKFKKWGIENVTAHIYDRYVDEDHKIESNLLERLSIGSRGPVTSHLKAIREWYENTDEEIAFFCEDDIGFDTVQYWNFTWEQFFTSLPSDWGCVQLVLLREEFSTFHIGFRHRCWCDWSACAYLITREHARLLIENYYSYDTFRLNLVGNDVHIRDVWAQVPVVETIIFSPVTQVYSAPLFVEDVVECKSSYLNLLGSNVDVSSGQADYYHIFSHATIMNWWQTTGNRLNVKQLIDLYQN